MKELLSFDKVKEGESLYLLTVSTSYEDLNGVLVSLAYNETDLYEFGFIKEEVEEILKLRVDESFNDGCYKGVTVLRIA